MLPDKLTLNTLLKLGISQYGPMQCAAFVDEEGYTYRHYASAIVAVQHFLRTKGLREGDRVAILGENSPQWGICYLAVTTFGAVAVPLLTDFQASEIGSILEHADVQGVCISQRLHKKASHVIPAGSWRLLIDELSEIDAEGNVIQSDSSAPKHQGPLAVGEKIENKIPDSVHEDDTAVILYTSGTTGKPKGVQLTHKNIVHNVVSTSYIPVKLRPGDRLLSILPLAHTYECTIGFLTPLLLGCNISYLRSLPAPTVLLPALKKVRPNVMLSVPLLMEKLYRNMIAPKMQSSALIRTIYRFPPGRRLLHFIIGIKLKHIFGGKMKYFIVGGASLSAEVERLLKEARFPLAKGYGLTETSPLIAGCTQAYDRIYSVGKPLRGVHIKIDSPAPALQAGEILVKGPNVTSGYYREPDRTKQAFDAEGWFHTGDLGTMDQDGYLTINGRLKNLILGPSGENIYPEEIEELLNKDDAVSEALVVEEKGRIIARIHPNFELLKEHGFGLKDLKDIEGYLNQLRKTINAKLAAFSRLAGIKVHKEPFEKTPTNKIKRYLYNKDQSDTHSYSEPDQK